MNTLAALLNRIGEQLGESSVTMLVQSSVLIAILATLDWLLRNRARAIVRYSLWMLLLVKLVLPVNLSLPTSIVRIESVVEFRPAVFPELPVIHEPMIEAPMEGVPQTTTLPPEPIRTIEPPVPLTVFGWLVLGWACVSGALLTLALWKSVQLHRLVRQCAPASAELNDLLRSCCEQIGVRPTVTLRMVEGKVTPALCGILRPTILLPASLPEALTPQELRAVLLHELAHLRRRDVLVNLAQTILQIVYFFHPLLWLANSRIRKLREQAVDELVLVTLGEEAEVYPETLLDVAKFTLNGRALTFGTVGIIESRSAFGARIRRILSRPFPKNARLGFTCVATMLALAFCVLPMASRAREEKPATVASNDTEFLANLRLLPDPMFPEYNAVTNRLAQSADTLLPLILESLKEPIADLHNDKARSDRAKKLWAIGFMGEKATPAIPLLIKELENDDPSMHSFPHYMNPPAFWAASALGAIGPAASNAVPALVEAARFGNYKAVPALARIAPESNEAETLAIETFQDRTKGNGGNISASRLAGLDALSLLADRSAKVRATLIGAMQDDDPPIRNGAVKLVVTSNLPGVRESIEKALAGDDLTRVNTAAALAQTGDQSERVRQILIDGLSDPTTRLKAVEALALVAPATPALIPTLLPFVNDPEQPLRIAVLELLARFPSTKSQAVVDAVLPLMGEGNSHLSNAAMNVLGRNGLVTAAVITALREAFRSSGEYVFETALNTAEVLKAPELGPDISAFFKDPALLQREDAVRGSVLSTLGSFPEAARELIPEITRELGGKNGWAAAITLGKLGPAAASAVPALIDVLSLTNNGVRNNSLNALGSIGPAAKPAIKPISAYLDSTEDHVQLNAALALWRIDRQKHILNVLKDRLESEKNWERLSLLNAVSTRLYLFQLVRELGPEAAPLRQSVEKYLDDPNPALRKAAGETIAVIKPAKTRSPYAAKSNEELLTEYELYSEHRSRSKALILSELLGRSDCVAFLAQVLRKDPEKAETSQQVRNRHKAATLLSRKGAAAISAVPALIDALEDDDDVRRAATDALAEIGPMAKAAIPVLLEELHFQNPRAAHALARIVPSSEEVQEAIVTAIMDPSKTPEFRSQSLEAMHHMRVRTKRLNDALKDLADSSDDQMKQTALRLSGQTSRRTRFLNTAPAEGRTTNDIPVLIKEIRTALETADRQNRFSLLNTINALTMVGTNSNEALDFYIELLEGKKVEHPGNLVGAIGRHGPRAAKATSLLVRLTEEEDPAIAQNALVSLGAIGPAAISAKSRLIELLEDPGPEVRWRAAHALRQIDPTEDDRCLPVLLAPFLDESEKINHFQIDVIGSFGPRARAAVPRLLTLLETDEWSSMSAAAALVSIDPSYTAKAVEVLTRALENPAVMNRHMAAQHLGKLGRAARSALPQLRAAAENSDNKWLKAFALTAIGQIEQSTQ